MGRLIDADALKERIRSFLGIKSLDDLLPEEKAIVQHIDRMPPVDAVPVVRCKYCEHHECYGGNIVLFCHRHGMMVAPDYYCGDGNGGDSIDDLLREWRYKQEVEAERERDEDGNESD